MAFSWVSLGKTEEAACNEALYLVAVGRIRRVARGQLGRNNESFLFLSVSVSTPPTLLLSCENDGSSGNFFGGVSRERQLEDKSSTAKKKKKIALQILNKYAQNITDFAYLLC